jgi:hypothetical protein
MFWDAMKPVIRAINILCVMLLAGMYVFMYYDYLQTITRNGSVTITGSEQQNNYSQLGVITINQQVSVAR